MKITNRLIVALFASLVVCAPARAEWKQISTAPVDGTDLQFIHPDTGWTINTTSAYGIYKTTNGGLAWTRQSQDSVYDFSFADGNNGWGVGRRSRIWKTTNGGTTWTLLTSKPQNPDSTYDFGFVRFANAKVGWVAPPGTSGRLMLTTNGGTHWSLSPTQPSGVLTTMAAPDSFTFFVSTRSTGANTIQRTTNQGSTWSSLTVADTPSVMFFLNSKRGWVGCEHGKVHRTTDGGASWTTAQTGLSKIQSLSFSGPDTGFALEPTRTGGGNYMAYTSDGGNTWKVTSRTIPKFNRFLFKYGTSWAMSSTGTYQYIPFEIPDFGTIFPISWPVKFTWEAFGYSKPTAKLEYTTGSNIWNPLATVDPASKSYDWITPSTAGATTIRISDPADATVQAKSFSLTLYKFKVTAPKPAEGVLVGSTYQIKWDALSVPSTSKISVYLSTNNGASWSSLFSVSPSFDGMDWTVPNTPTKQAKIRISNNFTESLTIADTSETFVIHTGDYVGVNPSPSAIPFNLSGMGDALHLRLPNDVAQATLTVNDMSGARVALLASGPLRAGTHDFSLRQAGLRPGMYLCSFEGGRYRARVHSVVLN